MNCTHPRPTTYFQTFLTLNSSKLITTEHTFPTSKENYIRTTGKGNQYVLRVLHTGVYRCRQNWNPDNVNTPIGNSISLKVHHDEIIYKYIFTIILVVCWHHPHLCLPQQADLHPTESLLVVHTPVRDCRQDHLELHRRSISQENIVHFILFTQ